MISDWRHEAGMNDLAANGTWVLLAGSCAQVGTTLLLSSHTPFAPNSAWFEQMLQVTAQTGTTRNRKWLWKGIWTLGSFGWIWVDSSSLQLPGRLITGQSPDMTLNEDITLAQILHLLSHWDNVPFLSHFYIKKKQQNIHLTGLLGGLEMSCKTLGIEPVLRKSRRPPCLFRNFWWDDLWSL